MTFDRSLLCSTIDFHSCMNPSESMSNVRETCPLPLLSIPCDEELSFATSTPTKSSGMAPPPFLSSDKTGCASPPILPRYQGSSMAQSSYYGSGRQGTDCTQGSLTQEELRSPALPILLSLYHIYW